MSLKKCSQRLYQLLSLCQCLAGDTDKLTILRQDIALVAIVWIPFDPLAPTLRQPLPMD